MNPILICWSCSQILELLFHFIYIILTVNCTLHKVLVGFYGGLSAKTPGERAKAYQEEAGDDFLEVKAELEACAGFIRRNRRHKATEEEQMVRDLQGIFCKDPYRSWRLPAKR